MPGAGRSDRVVTTRQRQEEPAREGVAGAGRVGDSDDAGHDNRGDGVAPQEHGLGPPLHDHEPRARQPIVVDAEGGGLGRVAEHDAGTALVHEVEERRPGEHHRRGIEGHEDPTVARPRHEPAKPGAPIGVGEAIERQVQHVGAVEGGRVERRRPASGAPIAEHGAGAAGIHRHDDRAGDTGSRHHAFDAERGQAGDQPRPGRVVADLADEPGAPTQTRDHGCRVGGAPAAMARDSGGDVGIADRCGVRLHDDVLEQVTGRADERFHAHGLPDPALRHPIDPTIVVMTPDELLAAARAWRDDDPDPATRAEVEALLGGDGAGAGAPDLDALRDRFGTSLKFGTAGLRGEMAAGPNRMNRATVIRATAGLARDPAGEGHAGEPVVVGFDARHRSAEFASDAAAVLAGAGFRVHLADRTLPTPVLAFGVSHLGCCAGVQVTASHNPPRDNGYKVYLGDGAQIVPPADAEIAARSDAVGPLSGVERAQRGDPRVTRVGTDLVEAYVAAAVDVAPRRSTPEGPPLDIVYTPLHGVGRDVLLAVFARAGFPAPALVPEQSDPDPDFPTVGFPNPEEPGALDLAFALAAERGADVVIANDPDADRLAVAVPSPTRGEWRGPPRGGSRAPLP